MTIRDDAQSTLGGDTIQMMKTKAALETMGITVESRHVSELERVSGYDIAHVFNIQTADSSWLAFETLRKQGIPTLLSPIYWDMLDHWFDLALDMSRLWRLLTQSLGKSMARQLYVGWQRRKAPRASTWRLQRLLLENALCVLPNSQSEGDLLQETFRLNGTFQQRTHVVPNGIDINLFDPMPQPGEWFTERFGVQDFVLEVGAVSPVKNQLGLIEALFDVPVPIVIVGQPAPEMPEYAKICRARADERGNVIFVDRLPHELLPGIYALAAVHALPSWRETPGLVSLEAAASGCRIVTTSIGSTRDYFGDMAHYCYPDDHQSIRDAVEAALAQPRSPQLREHILKNFNWQRAGEATLKAYEAVLSQPAVVGT